MIFCETLTPGYAMLMSPNKDETAVHGCHCPDDMAVRMRKVLAIPRSCAVWPLHSDGLRRTCSYTVYDGLARVCSTVIILTYNVAYFFF